jgi:hypothetical protein
MAKRKVSFGPCKDCPGTHSLLCCKAPTPGDPHPMPSTDKEIVELRRLAKEAQQPIPMPQYGANVEQNQPPAVLALARAVEIIADALLARLESQAGRGGEEGMRELLAKVGWTRLVVDYCPGEEMREGWRIHDFPPAHGDPKRPEIAVMVADGIESEDEAKLIAALVNAALPLSDG